jgi:peptidoglycan L-alanyl-D-glutamate endopeptidase CwlK
VNLPDPRSAKVIATLLLKVQPTFANLLIELKKHFQEKGIECKYISGHRTYAEQDALFSKGRTTPGPIVTKAKGGESNHNFGIAVDVGLFTPDGKYLEDTPFYRDIGPIVAKFPTLEWGGSWKFVDEPHIQWKTGLTMAQLRDRVASGKSIV